MGRLILVTGGARSGKSGYAQARAEALAGPRLYLATCQPFDDELRERVARHQADRADRGWATWEEPRELAAALARADGYRVILIDCLTLWLSNLLLADEAAMTESRASELAGELSASIDRLPATVVAVTNEVGWGVVPATALGRRFRDCQGRLNARLADAADEVILTVCGLPLTVKPAGER